MNEIIAIIPARAGSKSVINKNIKPLADHPLIAYSIAAAKLSKYISRVIVSTDSEEYSQIANIYGAETPFIRPASISKDNSTDLDFFHHCIDWFDQNEPNTPEYWVHLRPTTPLRDPKLIDSAISQFVNNLEATSLRSAHKAPESPFKWFKEDNGYFKGIVGDENNEIYNQPKENFTDVFVPDGHVDIVKKSHIVSKNNLHGSKILAFKAPFINEVDSIEEFEMIEYQILKKGSVLKDYLDNGR